MRANRGRVRKENDVEIQEEIFTYRIRKVIKSWYVHTSIGTSYRFDRYDQAAVKGMQLEKMGYFEAEKVSIRNI